MPCSVCIPPAFARLRGKRAKTDRIDAALIAQAAKLAVHSRKPYRAGPRTADLEATCRSLLHHQLAALKGSPGCNRGHALLAQIATPGRPSQRPAIFR